MNEIIVMLPYPHRIFGVTISLNKAVGFLFTNLSLFLFRENSGITTSDEYKAWLKNNGESRLITEMMFSAAQAYCMTYRKKQDFTKSKLTAAIATSAPETQQRIIDAWRKSQTFGMVEGKKKPITKRKM